MTKWLLWQIVATLLVPDWSVSTLGDGLFSNDIGGKYVKY